MHSRGRRVHQGSLGSLGCALVSLRSSGDAGFMGVRNGGRQVQPGSLVSLGCAPGFVGLIRGRVLPGGRRVQS